MHFGRRRFAARIRGVISQSTLAGRKLPTLCRMVALVASAAVITTVGGCAKLSWRPALKLPTSAPPSAVKSSLTHGPLVIRADFSLSRDDPLIAELAAEQSLIGERLGVPPGDAAIHVHLFADEAAYRRLVTEKFPEFSNRRAIFAETNGQLTVYAHWNERVAEDLRHEVAHGYLHAAVPGLPLWLDEGLAEFFELGDGGRGLHAGHIVLLRSEYAAGRWRPDLARLESMRSAADMRQVDYAEAWLCVHFMLNSSDSTRDLLMKRLSDLRHGATATSLSAELHRQSPDLKAAVLRHLTTIPL